MLEASCRAADENTARKQHVKCAAIVEAYIEGQESIVGRRLLFSQRIPILALDGVWAVRMRASTAWKQYSIIPA